MTVASYKHGENPRYDKMNYAELRNELDKRDELLKELFNLAAMNEFDVGEEMRFSEILNNLGIEV